jgi:bifunctional dihydroflavonol 4-reductase/flavanone 4-reductase
MHTLTTLVVGQPYFLSKTLSEKKAFELAEEYKLDLVTILPTLVTGPFLIEKIPNSVADALSLVTGGNCFMPDLAPN